MIISSKCIEIDNHCNEIIAELISLDQYVTYEKVYCILLQRYNSLCLNQLLGYENAVLEDIPTLSFLYELNKKVNYFLDAYFVTRSIISLKDLTYECTQFLQSFNLPSLYYYLGKKEHLKRDPFEIDIQKIDELECKTSLQFDDFGVGSLFKHSKLISIININGIISSDFSYHNFLSLNEVYDLLLDYMYQIKWQQVAFSTNEFAIYVSKKYNVRNLTSLGVVLIGELKSEINALQHSLNNRFNYIIELNKKELFKYNKQVDESVHPKRKKMKTHNILKEDNGDSEVTSNNSSININKTTVTVESDYYMCDKNPVVMNYNQKMMLQFSRENCLDDDDFIIIENAQLQGCFPLSVINNNANNNTYEINKMIGRWGEHLVYQYLITNRTPDMSIKWMNKDEESRLSYDFMIKNENKATCSTKNDIIYVEVKSTRYNDKNIFEITLWEWQFASSESQLPYHIYRDY